MNIRILIFCLVTAAMSGACSREPQPAKPVSGSPGVRPPAHAVEPEPTRESMVIPSVRVEGAIRENASRSPGERVSAKGLSFTLPPKWTPVTAQSAMRALQAEFAQGDVKMQLTMFHFGAGMGGSVKDNIDRWLGQVESGDGVHNRDEYDAGDFHLTWMQKNGTLRASPMSGQKVDLPGYSLFGIIVEGEGGPWFIKITGPMQAVDAHKESFFTMMRSFQRDTKSTR